MAEIREVDNTAITKPQHDAACSVEVTVGSPGAYAERQIAETLGSSAIRNAVVQMDNDEWQSQALCRDVSPDLFFPVDKRDEYLAKRICADCPVQAPCLEYALEHREKDGVWGGTGEDERRKILKVRLNRKRSA